jgi:Sulfotransferase family
MSEPTPIFLLSLPRSGSTLVQRVMAAHEEIATAPEPWILLPQVYALRERGAYAEYGQIPSSRAIREFIERLPRGTTDYDDGLRSFVLGLYSKAAKEHERYFLDKTPRYHLILDDLFRIFPEARFIFLWRHPLAVVASIVETWGRGAWNLAQWHVDVNDGLSNLVGAFEEHSAQSFAVRYEDLVASPTSAWPSLFDYLEIPFDPRTLETFDSVDVAARMGDRTGSRNYRTLATEPLTKWHATVRNPFRQRWCRSYLRWIGAERLEIMGYDLEVLLDELDNVPGSGQHLGVDLLKNGYAWSKRVGRERAAAFLWQRRLR